MFMHFSHFNIDHKTKFFAFRIIVNVKHYVHICQILKKFSFEIRRKIQTNKNTQFKTYRRNRSFDVKIRYHI